MFFDVFWYAFGEKNEDDDTDEDDDGEDDEGDEDDNDGYWEDIDEIDEEKDDENIFPWLELEGNTRKGDFE